MTPRGSPEMVDAAKLVYVPDSETAGRAWRGLAAKRRYPQNLVRTWFRPRMICATRARTRWTSWALKTKDQDERNRRADASTTE